MVWRSRSSHPGNAALLPRRRWPPGPTPSIPASGCERRRRSTARHTPTTSSTSGSRVATAITPRLMWRFPKWPGSGTPPGPIPTFGWRPTRTSLRAPKPARGLHPGMARRLGDWWADGLGSGARMLGWARPGPSVVRIGKTSCTRGPRPERLGGGAAPQLRKRLRGRGVVRRAHVGSTPPVGNDEEGWGSGDLQWQRKAAFARDPREAATALVSAGGRRMAERGPGAAGVWRGSWCSTRVGGRVPTW